MWQVPATFLAALAQSHTVTNRVELWYGNSLLNRDLTITSGSVSGSRNAVRRNLSLAVTAAGSRIDRRNLWEQVALPGIEVRAFRGIQFLDGSQTEVPVGVFIVQQPQIDEATGGISFGSCPDRMQRVVNYTFEAPRTSSSGFTYAQQIQQLIGEAVTGLSFVDQSGDHNAVPAGTVWESDRAGAVADLATAIGCEIGFNQAGQAVLYRPKSFATPADWKITPAANIVSAAATIDWTNTYNIVVASGDQTDGTVPVFATARDTDPNSPTYWLGPLGPKPMPTYSSPLLTSSTMAQAAALALLAQSTGAQKQIDLTTLANPALDLNDRVDVVLLAAGWSERHLVDSLSISLTGATMTVGTRATGATGVTDA